MRKAKAFLKLNLAKDVKDQGLFTNRKRKARESVALLLNKAGVLVTGYRGEVIECLLCFSLYC